MRFILGIDIGTTGARTILISEIGAVFTSATSNYSLNTPHPGWTEQSPEDWWHATLSSVSSCLKQAKSVRPDISIEGIGLTGQMHGSVFLDEKGQVIRPAILWNDQRTEEQCRHITDAVGFSRLLELTGNRALTGFTAPKILWLREHEPHNYERIQRVLLPKDYIRFKLTGIYATEVSDASGTLLFNVSRRQWSEEMLAHLKIPRDWMPECYESTYVSSYISAEAASQIGLKPGIPVVGGAGDQAAGAVGNGIVRQGDASCSIGTSGVIFWPSDKPAFDSQGRLHSFCHAIPGKWHLMGVTLSAGGSLKWFRDSLCNDIKTEAVQKGIDPYEIIDSRAAEIPPGAEGLIFLPYISGERTPHADPKARGAFIGLSLRHSRNHMARAVMEGVTMSLKDCIELGNACGMETKSMLISGGGGRSALWRQIAADIFGLEICRINVDEGPAYGAAILASVGAGFFKTVEEACASYIKITEYRKPEIKSHDRYARFYDLYKPLYNTLRAFYINDYEFVSQNSLSTH